MKILVTAGPTYEPIDAVRFIGNRSSGKMGVAIADVFASKGNEVILVKGPSSVVPESQTVKTVNVETAEEMFVACKQYFEDSDVIVFAAAVADYTPKEVSKQKIKKSDAEFSVELKKTKDIALELGKSKKSDQITVIFALETEKEIEHAETKLAKKNADFVVLNSLNDKGAGFQSDTNKITIIDREGKVTNFGLKSKKEVAADIVQYIQNIQNKS